VDPTWRVVGAGLVLSHRTCREEAWVSLTLAPVFGVKSVRERGEPNAVIMSGNNITLETSSGMLSRLITGTTLHRSLGPGDVNTPDPARRRLMVLVDQLATPEA